VFTTRRPLCFWRLLLRWSVVLRLRVYLVEAHRLAQQSAIAVAIANNSAKLNGGKMQQTAKHTARKVQTLEREAQMLEMRKMGYTYAQIAERYGLHLSTVYKIVQRAVERYRKQVLESAEELLQMELARLDALMVAHFARALEGDHQSAKRVLEIIALRSKLLGLDRMTQQDSGDLEIRVCYAATDSTA
jgi:DNA-binding CsgD family transcriptional regulator